MYSQPSHIIEAQLRAVTEVSDDAIIVTDVDGIVTLWNSGAERLYAYPASEAIGRSVALVVPEDMQPELETIKGRLAQGESIEHLETRRVDKDGKTIEISLSAHPVRDASGAVVGAVAAIRDITNQKRRERELEERAQEREEQYRSIFESVRDGVTITDPEGRIVEANPAFCAMMGYSRDELIGSDARMFIHPDSQHLFPAFLDHNQDDVVFHAQAINVRKDGTLVPVDVRGSSFMYRGRPHILGVVRDETERKRADEKLREKEQQYRSIFEATSDAVFINDLDGYVVEANPAACAMHGYACDELVGMHRTVYIHPDYHPRLSEYLEGIQQNGAFHIRSMNVRKDGSVFPVDVHGTTFLYRGTPHVLGVVRDITEQVQAYELLERRVEERTRELSTLLEISQDVASTLDLQPLLSMVLDQLKNVVDYVDSSILLRDGDNLVHLEYRGPIPREDILHLPVPMSQDGMMGEALLRGEPVIIDDARGDSAAAREYWQVLGEEYRDRFLHIRSWLGVPLMVKDRFIGLLAVISDQPGHYTPAHAQLALIAANQAAIAIENARLYTQAQELAAVEERQRLARELHDSVTQALFSMTMHARAAQMTLEREGIAVDSKAAENVMQLRELAQGALAEMRALIFELRPKALQEEGLVAALRKHAAAVSAREGLAIRVEVPADRPSLEPGTEEHLYRAAQEALHNVIKHAGATHVLVRVEVGADTVVLEVTDNGVGFDPSDVPAGHLGLRTMAERTRQIGGTIDVASTPGQGTRVQIVAPCAAPLPAGTVHAL